jgi:hypothetical protein
MRSSRVALLILVPGKLLHAFFKRTPFNPGSGKEFIRNQPVKFYQILYKDLQLDLDVIVIDVDFGDIGRILSTGQINPVGIRWSANNKEETNNQNNETNNFIHYQSSSKYDIEGTQVLNQVAFVSLGVRICQRLFEKLSNAFVRVRSRFANKHQFRGNRIVLRVCGFGQLEPAPPARHLQDSVIVDFEIEPHQALGPVPFGQGPGRFIRFS